MCKTNCFQYFLCPVCFQIQSGIIYSGSIWAHIGFISVSLSLLKHKLYLKYWWASSDVKNVIYDSILKAVIAVSGLWIQFRGQGTAFKVKIIVL